MATSRRVLALLATGRDHDEVGRELGLPPGQVYLIATGIPADGSGPPPAHPRPPGHLASPQRLVHPPVHNPTAREAVHRWVARRAREMNV